MKHLTILLVVAFVFINTTKAQQCGLRLSGHVHSTATHENLANSTVYLREFHRTIVTDANGDFTFDSLCAGTYNLLITHTSYDTIQRKIILSRNQHLDIDLLPLQDTLSLVTVTAIRSNPVSGIVQEVPALKLESSKSRSLAGALSQINGVTMLQRGATISKPVIHGLHSNRILTINNGVRQEGQQWGNEHAPEIDPFIANKITVIKGADELRYGSDAIGGVVLVEPRPLRNIPGYNAEFNTVYSTNNKQYVVSGIFEQQVKRWPAFTYRLQGTFKKGANMTTPHYRLNNTGIEEKNFSATAGWRKEHFNTELYYSLFNTQVGIFSGTHIGNITDLENAIAAEKPDETFTGQQTYRIGRPYQDVTHQLLKWKTGIDLLKSKFNVLVAAQYNQRQEYDVVRSASTTAPQINLSVFTLTEDVNWEHPRKNNFSGVMGITATQQDNSYTGRYLIPNYRSYSYGGYVIEKWAPKNWDLQAGVRYDFKSIDTRRLQAASQTFTSYHFDFSTFATSFNAGYRFTPGLKTTAAISIATRAPHVNELLTNGVHHGAGTYEIGDINLQPERSFNVSLNSRYTNEAKWFDLDLTLYRNHIANFIYQQPKPDEPVLTIRGAFPRIVYQSTDALLQGLDASATFTPWSPLSFTTKYSLLRARNLSIDDWLIGMPSDRFTNELTWRMKDGEKFTNAYINLEVEHVANQKRVPDEREGKQDYKLPPDAYTLVHADMATTFSMGKMPLTIGVSARNLLNKAYREYLNSFRYFTNEMGRNISLRLKIDLQHIYE